MAIDLDVSPLAGWRYARLDDRCSHDRALFALDTAAPLTPSVRGCCWNALTQCLLICDPVHCCVRVFRVRLSTDASASKTTASPQLLFATNTDMPKIGDRGTGSGKFQLPVAVDVNARGEIAVADAKLGRVQVFMGSGTLQYYFGRPGGSRGEFRGLCDLKFTLLGHLALVDSGNHRVQIMTQTGGVVAIIGAFGTRPGAFDSPSAVAVARSGELFVCDAGNKRIQRLSAKGKPLAVWGSRRERRYHRRRHSSSSAVAMTNNDSSSSSDADAFDPPLQLQSVFDAPLDLTISPTNGDIVVCDGGTQRRVLIFSDTGACRHVLSSPDAWEPIAVRYCGASLLTIMCLPLGREGVTHNDSESNNTELASPSTPAYAFAVRVHAPLERVGVGKLAAWPERCIVHTLRFLTYADALDVRCVNRLLHRICRALRNAWELAPLTPGTSTVRKYNRVVQRATGLVAVVEAFETWGLRVFTPSHRTRRHVLAFESGFCHAISALYGAMFRFQHEDVLRALFDYHARGRDEIDQAAFIEIVTVVEEVRAGLLAWRQCIAFARNGVPRIRDASALPLVATDAATAAAVPASLRLVESAQQLQMNKLLLKLRSL